MSTLGPRFWAKVNKTETCWLWTASVTKSGYGQFTPDDAPRGYIHRLAYVDAYGPIPSGLMVDHKCHERRCVNPAHLQAVTNSQNAQNRSGPAVNSRSGVRGVHWAPRAGKWRVQIRARGRNWSGGLYDDLAEAGRVASELRASLMSNSLQDSA